MLSSVYFIPAGTLKMMRRSESTSLHFTCLTNFLLQSLLMILPGSSPRGAMFYPFLMALMTLLGPLQFVLNNVFHKTPYGLEPWDGFMTDMFLLINWIEDFSGWYVPVISKAWQIFFLPPRSPMVIWFRLFYYVQNGLMLSWCPPSSKNKLQSFVIGRSYRHVCLDIYFF